MLIKLFLKIYEKISQKAYRDPVERLREKGAVIGENVHIFDSGGATLDYSFANLLEIGDNVTISNSTILLHDASIKKELHYVKIGKIKIGDNVFVGAGSIILPNICIGNKVIIGAGSVVSKNIPDGVVAAGNPIRIIGTYDAYMEKCSSWIEKSACYNEFEFINGKEPVGLQTGDWAFLRND